MTRNWDGFIWETGVFLLCGLSARRRSAPFFKRFVLKTVSFFSKPYQICHCEEGAFFAPDAAIFDGTRRHHGTKHGPISLIEDNTLVVALATVQELFEKTMSNVKEVKARGANVLGVTTARNEAEIAKSVDRYLLVPQTHPVLQPSLNVVPLQIFAYYVALARDCDVDKPRNLAKSVTVE